MSYLGSESHKHKCRCGNIWEHDLFHVFCVGSKVAHTCGKCGNEVYEKYRPKPPGFFDTIIERLKTVVNCLTPKIRNHTVEQ